MDVCYRNLVRNLIFLPGTSLVFSMYIEMNNKLTFLPTFVEMTLLLLGLLITVLLILLLT